MMKKFIDMMSSICTIKLQVIMKRYILLFILVGFTACKFETKIFVPVGIAEKFQLAIQDNNYTIILYLDSTECSPCTLKPLIKWKLHKVETKKYKLDFLLVYNGDESEIRESMNFFDLDFPCILDENKDFFNANIMNFNHSTYALVIDKHYKVVFTGIPFIDEKRWNKFLGILN
jgi:hypothetical protein